MRMIGKGFNIGSRPVVRRGASPVSGSGPAASSSSNVVVPVGDGLPVGVGLGVGSGVVVGVGVVVGSGASAGTVAVASERFESDPRLLLTVSSTRMTAPISDADTT